MVTRGEVWLVRLDPTVGSEIRKTRPCLVVSPDCFSRLPMVLVAPMSSRGRPARFRVPVEFANRSGFVLPDQIRTVSTVRLIRRVGVIDSGALVATLATLREMFAE